MVQRGRHVLVVGATGRLGAAIAHGLAARGDRPVLTARDPSKPRRSQVEVVQRPSCARERSPLTSPPTSRTATPSSGSWKGCARSGQGPQATSSSRAGAFPADSPEVPPARGPRADALTVHAVVPLLLVHALSSDLAAAQGAVVALADAGITRPFMNHVAYLTAKGALATGLRARSPWSLRRRCA